MLELVAKSIHGLNSSQTSSSRHLPDIVGVDQRRIYRELRNSIHKSLNPVFLRGL